MTAVVKWTAWALFAIWTPVTFVIALVVLPVLISGRD